eukprot:TRINITY_DN7953_c0_g1_i2.p1 TRINITY_DN7953_c0_g1~~TRINITY_DN7953_c0_g1_i2.p1  ORF type:complete len:211 (+),score=30.17 TRINITY_DN7953_c0_g1_i2:73-705(+)
MQPISTFVPELLRAIFLYLDPRTLPTLGLVCKNWQILLNQEGFWTNVLDAHFPEIQEVQEVRHKFNPKMAYQNLLSLKISSLECHVVGMNNPNWEITNSFDSPFGSVLRLKRSRWILVEKRKVLLSGKYKIHWRIIKSSSHLLGNPKFSVKIIDDVQNSYPDEVWFKLKVGVVEITSPWALVSVQIKSLGKGLKWGLGLDCVEFVPKGRY